MMHAFKVKAKCPKCEKIHEIKGVSTGKFTPRVFCEQCRKSVIWTDFKYDDNSIYEQ